VPQYAEEAMTVCHDRSSQHASDEMNPMQRCAIAAIRNLSDAMLECIRVM
jgi:hypothetical protein